MINIAYENVFLIPMQTNTYHPRVLKLLERDHRSMVDFIWRCSPWDESRGCITIEKLFGYQLRAPKRLVLQVVNELGLFNAAIHPNQRRDHPWSLIYIAVNGVAPIQIALCSTPVNCF